MKIFSILFWITFLFAIIKFISANKNKNSGSKYDRAYMKCKNGECSTRSNDEACIMKCISDQCHQNIYGNYLLEYGEINYDLKNKFESCFNTHKK
jgi:hypothetical protein